MNQQQHSPPGRSRHCFAADPATGHILMFGGIAWHPTSRRHDALLDDTWILQDETWSPVPSPKHPKGRHRGTMNYDTVRHQWVLFGGQDSGNVMLRDTWTHDGSMWNRVKRPLFASWPKPRCGHAMAFDRSLGQTVLFGGINYRDHTLSDTWIFDGEQWKELLIPGPHARRYAAFGYCPQLEGCLLHGGCHDDHGQLRFDDTWLFAEGYWRSLGRAFETDERDDHAIAVAESTGDCYLFPAVGDDGFVFRYADDGWEPTALPPPNPDLQCAPVAWHQYSNSFVAFGGEEGHAAAQSNETRFVSLEE